MRKNKITQETHTESGYRFCRFRLVKGSMQKGEPRWLDAWEYGYKAWRFPIKSK